MTQKLKEDHSYNPLLKMELLKPLLPQMITLELSLKVLNQLR